MAISISQPCCSSEPPEDSATGSGQEQLHDKIARLQVLVCELLLQNQQLRFQSTNE
jgi:hypothetical protein